MWRGAARRCVHNRRKRSGKIPEGPGSDRPVAARRCNVRQGGPVAVAARQVDGFRSAMEVTVRKEYLVRKAKQRAGLRQPVLCPAAVDRERGLGQGGDRDRGRFRTLAAVTRFPRGPAGRRPDRRGRTGAARSAAGSRRATRPECGFVAVAAAVRHKAKGSCFPAVGQDP